MINLNELVINVHKDFNKTETASDFAGYAEDYTVGSGEIDTISINNFIVNVQKDFA